MRLLIVVLSVLSVAACSRQEPEPLLEDLVLPIPSFKDLSPCTEPNDLENERAQLALRAFEIFSWPDEMTIGVGGYFGQDRYRWTSDTSVWVCPPTETYPRLTELLLDVGYFDGGHLFIEGVELARMLGPRDQRIVDAVARTAFHKHPIRAGEPLHRDVRPFARTVLAEFDAGAGPYAEQAYAELSAETAFGTGAAQIAVAGGHPDALDAVAREMKRLLAEQEDPISYRYRNRILSSPMRSRWRKARLNRISSRSTRFWIAKLIRGLRRSA